MVAYRNALFALAATAMLVGGLIFLFPTPGQASFVHLTSGGVGLPDANGDFTVTFSVEIPAGEHIPADFVQVLVADGTTGLDGTGTLQDALCDARTDGGGSAGASVTVLDITGTRVEAEFFGYGYDVAPSSNGYEFTDASVVFDGETGDGYGGQASVATTIQVKVRVSGCASAITFDGNGRADLRMQAFLGASDTLKIKSFPVSVTFTEAPTVGGTATSDPNDVNIVVSQSSSGGLTSTDMRLDAASGDDFIAAGVTLDIQAPTGSGFNSLTVETSAPLPSGSRIVVTVQSAATGGTPSLTSPPFGISVADLATQTNVAPAFFVQIALFVPGEGEVDPADYFSRMDFDVDVPQTYFTGLGRPPARFAMRGFDDEGELKEAHPARVAGPTLNAGIHTYTFRITAFSSFAGFAQPALGGGGGFQPTPTPEATPTPTSTPPTPPGPDPTSTPPPVDPDLDSDGDGVPDWVEILLGTDPHDISSVPTFRMTDVQAEHTAAGVRITWGEPPVPVEGFQIWRSASPWILLATLDGDDRSYTDTDPVEGGVYQVTFFMGREAGLGYVAPGDDPRDSLWEFPEEGEGTAPQAQPEATPTPGGPTGTGKWWGIAIIVLLIAAAIAVAVALFMKRREHG